MDLSTSQPGAARDLGRRATGARVVAAIPCVLLVVSAVAAAVLALTGLGAGPDGPWTFLPAGPLGHDRLEALASAIGLTVAAVGLARGKRLSLGAALLIFGAAALVQAALPGHVAAAALDVVALWALFLTHRRYVARTGGRAAWVAPSLAAIGLVVAVLGALDLSLANGLVPALPAAVAAAAWLGFADPTALTLAPLASLGSVMLAARLFQLLGLLVALRPAAAAEDAVSSDHARGVIRRHGSGALLPYQTGRDASAFAVPEAEGALTYARAGRTAVVLGDPIGAGQEAWTAFDAWLDRCRRLDWLPGIYQASSNASARLAGAGWHPFLVGLEAIVDPLSFDIRRSRVANVRHTVTRARKGGVVATWSAAGPRGLPDPEGVVAQMATLDAAWRAAAGPQMGFTVGRFDPDDLDGCGIAVARAGDGNVEAFAILRPTGTDEGWMLDLMRRRRGGVPGSVEACLVAAIEGLRRRGVRRFSLGLAPLSGLDPAHGPIPERAMALGARLLRPFYDYPGLAFYKNKFDPVWEPRYVVVRHRRDLFGVGLALVRLHLGGSWARVARSLRSAVRPPASPARAKAA